MLKFAARKIFRVDNKRPINYITHRVSYFTEKSKKEKTPEQSGNIDVYKSDLEEISKKILRHEKEIEYYFGKEQRSFDLKATNHTQFFAKKFRQFYLRSGDWSSNKHIIEVKRLRTPKEKLFKLLKQGEIACEIEGREEFPPLHFVIDKKFSNRITGKPLSTVMPFYVKNGHEEIRCTLVSKDVLPDVNQSPFKLRFQRYIPGRPNLLTLEIKLVSTFIAPQIRSLDCELTQYYKTVEVWCKNEDYPPLFEIDARNLFPFQPFKFRDLINMLPEGMWLHRKYDSVINHAIFTLGENFNVLLASKLYPINNPEKYREGQDQIDVSEYEAAMQQMKEARTSKLKKPTKVTVPLKAASGKKLMLTKSEGATPKSLKNLPTKVHKLNKAKSEYDKAKDKKVKEESQKTK